MSQHSWIRRGLLCAVVGCEEQGAPQVCPYDGAKHGHGRIHYNCHRYQHFAPKSKLRFRNDQWRLLCERHYQQVLRELGKEQAP